jgi:GT2 family glycosyltransferase
VWAVVVNWNGADETLGCLLSLRGCVPPLTGIIVVDNGSDDASVERIRAAHQDVVLIRNARNLGFAGGANPGIRAALGAGARWVLLMNNDARLDPDAVSRLVAAADLSPGVGLAGGKIYRDRASGTLWCCGVVFGGGPNLGRLRGFGEKDDGRFDRREIVDSLTGCGLLVRREVFERIGLLDEAYFAYVEDADFAMRAREAGFSCLYEPAACFEHPGGTATGGGYSAGRKYLTAHGAARFLKRHGTARRWFDFLLFDLVAWPLVFAVAVFRGRSAGAVAKLRGTIDGLLGRPPDLTMLKRRG